MLFFRQKQKTDDILPPPPPDSELELEKELSGPKFFDKTIEPEKVRPFPEESEFASLIEDLGSREQSEVPIKKDKVIDKRAKGKKLLKDAKPSKRQAKKAEAAKGSDILDFPEDFGNKIGTLDDLEFELRPRETWNVGFDKPKEVLEAEDEIKSAIDRIKRIEAKPSFFKRVFSKKQAVHEDNTIQEEAKPAGTGSLQLIQDKVNEARQLVMELDLDGARASYIEIMKMYNNLKPDDQMKVYQDIKNLYFERKNAEGFNRS